MTNAALSFYPHPKARVFTLKSNQFEGTRVTAGFALTGWAGSAPLALSASPWEIEPEPNPHGSDLPLEVRHRIRINLSTTLPGVTARVHAALLAEKPLLMMKMVVRNDGDTPLHLDRLTMAQIQDGGLRLLGSLPSEPAFYSQGWQSWSSSGSCQPGSQQQKSILERFQVPMIFNPGTPRPRNGNLFSGDMFGVFGDLKARIGFLGGFLSQKYHFGSLQTRFAPVPELELWANGDDAMLPPGSCIETDWAACGFVTLDAPDPLGDYLAAAAAVNNIQSQAPIPVGWCSWYHFYTKINEAVIESNLDAVVDLQPDLPLPLFQIDDGFETYPGDWFDFVPGFPEGLSSLARKARRAGLTPGLWLAPFIVHPRSRLVREHPDWLLRDKKGRRVTAGFVWNRFTYALDLTHPAALAYTRQVIRTAVEDWGFTYLKLDFLYAAALDGQYQDPTKTRAQVMRMGLEALREAAGPQVTLLGCGCPLGSGLGLFEAMRISADVSGYWAPHFPPVSFILRNEPNMPAARNAIQNILSRAFLHRRWWVNDPDCLLVRPDTDLTLAEVRTLATAISMTGGSLLLSDDLPALPNDRLRLAQVLLPLIGQRAQVIDWMDRYTPSLLRLDLEGPTGLWHLLAYFNWHEHQASLEFSPQAFHLPGGGIYWAREFWTGQIGQMGADAPLLLQDVPPHGVRVLAARAFTPQMPVYIGSSLHLSQGMEVSTWDWHKDSVSFSFDVGHKLSGKAFLYLPKSPLGAWINGHPQMPQPCGQGMYAMNLDEARESEVHVKF